MDLAVVHLREHQLINPALFCANRSFDGCPVSSTDPFHYSLPRLSATLGDAGKAESEHSSISAFSPSLIYCFIRAHADTET